MYDTTDRTNLRDVPRRFPSAVESAEVLRHLWAARRDCGMHGLSSVLPAEGQHDRSVLLKALPLREPPSRPAAHLPGVRRVVLSRDSRPGDVLTEMQIRVVPSRAAVVPDVRCSGAPAQAPVLLTAMLGEITPPFRGRRTRTTRSARCSSFSWERIRHRQASLRLGAGTPRDHGRETGTTARQARARASHQWTARRQPAGEPGAMDARSQGPSGRSVGRCGSLPDVHLSAPLIFQL